MNVCCYYFRYYSSWIEAEEQTTDESTSLDSLALGGNSQRRKVISEIKKLPPKNFEECLLQYQAFDAPSEMKSHEDYEISWSNEFNSMNSVDHYSYSSSSTEDDDEEDDDDDDDDDSADDESDSKDDGEESSVKRSRHNGAKAFLQKKSNIADSSEDIIFGVDESFFQIGETSDSYVSEQIRCINSFSIFNGKRSADIIDITYYNCNSANFYFQRLAISFSSILKKNLLYLI